MMGDVPFDTISPDHKCKMNDYGEVGLVTGKHIIRCQGIGYQYSQATNRARKKSDSIKANIEVPYLAFLE
jgi:hypothetical protein